MKLITLFITIIIILCSNSLARQSFLYQKFGGAPVTNTTSYGQNITYVANIDYLGTGYNIYYGNPKSSKGIDPGYTHFKLIDLQYEKNCSDSLSIDKQYMLPKGVTVETLQNCQVEFSSKQIKSLSSYRDSLKTSAKVNSEFPAGSFSASVDYKQVKEGLSGQDSIQMESNAECLAHKVNLQDNQSRLPPLSKEYIELLQDLEKQINSQDAFFKFFDIAGTHVTSEITLGSMFGYRYQMDANQVQNAVNTGTNIESSLDVFSMSMRASVATESESSKMLRSAITSWTTLSIGALPERNNDGEKWATQTLLNPMPIKNKLLTMSEFLEMYQSVIATPFVKDMPNLIRKIKEYSKKYCIFLKTSSCEDEEVLSKYQGFKPQNSYLGVITQPNYAVQIVLRGGLTIACKEITYAGDRKENNVVLQPYNGSDSHKWYLVPVDSCGDIQCNVKIVNYSSGLCITDYTQYGADLHYQFTCQKCDDKSYQNQNIFMISSNHNPNKNDTKQFSLLLNGMWVRTSFYDFNTYEQFDHLRLSSYHDILDNRDELSQIFLRVTEPN